MKINQNSVEIDATTVKLDGKKQLVYNVIIGMQDTPLINLDQLRELRRLCDVYIKLGESVAPQMSEATSRYPEPEDTAADE